LAAPQVAGGLHHRFGIGDSFIVIVDEWKSVDHFQKFFGDPDLQAFIGSVGGAPCSARAHRLRSGRFTPTSSRHRPLAA